MMKPIIALFVLFLSQLTSFAQQADVRTTTTKIADLLALQPAESSERFEVAMQQLERFSASDISALLQRLTPPGTGNNAEIEYATNSYSYYVLQPGKNQQRTVFLKGAADALSTLTNKDNQGYVIQLLQNAGDDTVVAILGKYLHDEYLSEKAARALARIGSENAGAVLTQALPAATENAAIPIVNALGFLGYAAAEQPIAALVGTSDSDLRKAALAALSNIGGTAAQPLLKEAAAAVGYVYDPTDATAAYLNYTRQLVSNGDEPLARKCATQLFKDAKTDDQVHTRIAALTILTQLDGTRELKTLTKAATSENPVYRNASLNLLAPYLDDRIASRLTKGLTKADEQVQVDLLRFLGTQRQSVALPTVRKLLHTGTPKVRIAAVGSLHKLAGDDAVEELLPLIPGKDSETQQAIKTALLTSKNQPLAQLVTNALASQNDVATQLLLMDVLAQKGVRESAPVIFKLTGSETSNEVKAAAYQALPHVVGSADLDKLLAILPKVEQQYVAHIQRALVNAVEDSNDKDNQIKQLVARLKQADASQQPRFFPVLAGIGGREALTTVASYADQDDPVLRSAATSALANWINADALTTLVVLSRKKIMDAAQTDAVINGLVRIVGLADLPAEQKVLHLRDAFDMAETAAQKKSILRALEANKTYNALLFAGRFLDDDELKSTAANTVMNIALEEKRLYGADVTRLLNNVIGLLSGSESSYLREAVQKHLHELPKDQGYVSLFNGRDLTGWKGLVANPIKRAAMDPKTLAAEQAKADEVMKQGWYAADGVLHFNGKGDNIATVKQYGDFELLVDWKLDKEGKEGDAGIYLRGTPQVQIWDTSRVNVGAQVGSGGLYNNQQHESKPLKVADNPLGEWNTFRITMVGDRVTVYLNGELVTDSVVLENYWDRSQPIFPREQIELQAHGTHVSYRDIFIRELPRKEVFVLPEAEKNDGFETLFDGTNIAAWTGNTAAYRISDEGTLAIYPTEDSGGNLYTKEEFADFIYRFEFRLTPGANNGIGIRAPMEGDAAYVGMEIQVLDDDAAMYKDLAPYQYHGSVYGIIPAKRGHLRPMGEWNEEEIRIQGNTIKVTLNGTVIVDGDLVEATKNGTLDGKNHPGLKRKSGHIAFLGHGSEVHFRNIRVKRL